MNMTYLDEYRDSMAVAKTVDEQADDEATEARSHLDNTIVLYGLYASNLGPSEHRYRMEGYIERLKETKQELENIGIDIECEMGGE